MMRRGWLFGMALALLMGAGCGDDGGPPSAFSDAGPLPDAGPPPDAGPDPDAGGGIDAGPPPDGATADGAGLGDGGALPCASPSTVDVLSISSDTLDDARPVAVAPGVDRFVVAWHELRDGKEDVFARIVPVTGDPPADVRITDDFAISRDPAVLDTGSSVLVAWYDNSASGFEIYVQGRTAMLAADGSPIRLTDNELRNQSPVLIPFDGQVLAAWIETDLGDVTNAVTRVLATDGTPAGDAVVASPEGSRPSNPRLAKRLGGALMSWYEGAAGASDAVVQRLDGAGGATGTSVGLSTEHNASSSPDLAQLDTGGAAVFDVAVEGVRPEVRFRVLDETGAPSASAPERIVTTAPERGLDSSVAAFQGGWAVAYRALEDEGLSGPVVRLALLDVAGDVVNVLDLADASDVSSPTRVAVASDGTLLVAWADVDTTAGETAVRAARVRCD